jgi:hypothetical protein
VTAYKSPTSLVWLLGRIYCTGTPEDYAAVHAIQDACSLVPLSAYGKSYTPPPGAVDPSIDMKTAVREQVNRMDAIAFFTLLAELMKTNPPAPVDKPMLEKLARIGIVPGQDFDRGKFDVDFARRVPEVGFDRIMLHFRFSDDVKDVNGWGFTLKTGLYGTDYVQRALITAIGLGATSSGRGLSDVAARRRRRQLRRRQDVCNQIPQRNDAAGPRVLVDYDVQR